MSRFCLVGLFLLLIVGLSFLSFVCGNFLPFFCGLIPFLILSRRDLFSFFRRQSHPVYHGFITSYVTVIYVICVFVAGCGQFYNMLVYGNPLITHDELLFYSLSVDNLTEMRWSSLVDHSLHLLIWRFFYLTFRSLGGVTCGVWLGILVNIIILCVAVYFWLHIGDICLPRPEQRNLFCRLVALNPMVWLFGVSYLRDNVVLLINALTLYCLIKFRHGILWSILGLFWLIVLTLAMYWTRSQMAFLPSITALVYYLVYSLPNIIIWFRKSFVNSECEYVGINRRISWICFENNSRLLVGIINCWRVLLVFGSLFVIVLLLLIFQKIIVEANDCYRVYGSVAYNRINSPAMSWLFAQSLPSRVFLGGVSLLLAPVPVWFFLYSGADFYHILKVCYWAVMLVVWPMFFASCWSLLRNIFQIKKIWLFCLLYSWLMIAAVGVSSCEIRHLGVFVLYITLVASYNAGQWRWPVLFKVAVCYYLLVVFVHIYVVYNFER